MNSQVVECGICYDEIVATKNNCVTSCGHQFCMGCFIKTTQQSNCCPICRTELYEEMDEEDEESVWTEEDGETDEMDEDDDESTVMDEPDIQPNDVTIEKLQERLEKQGMTFKDVVTLLFLDIPSTEASHNFAARRELEKKMDAIYEEMENEGEEMESMEKEDTNALIDPLVRTQRINTTDEVNILIPRRITRTAMEPVARNLLSDFENEK
jgi:hypothetical protein